MFIIKIYVKITIFMHPTQWITGEKYLSHLHILKKIREIILFVPYKLFSRNIFRVFFTLLHHRWKNKKFTATQFFSSNWVTVKFFDKSLIWRKTLAVKFRNLHTVCMTMWKWECYSSWKNISLNHKFTTYTFFRRFFDGIFAKKVWE